MGNLATYFWARTMLDDAIHKLREDIAAAIERSYADANAGIATAEGALDGLDGAEIVVSFRFAAARAVIEAWQVGRAALLGLVLPQVKGALNFPVSTRRRFKPGGARKTFPSDSTQAEYVVPSFGHRAHYRTPHLPRILRKLPKLAILSEHKVGRPKHINETAGLYRRKLAKASYLRRRREATAQRRYAKGWKQYPKRKYVGEPTGWREPERYAERGSHAEQRSVALRANLKYQGELREAKQRAWEEAH